MTEQPDQSAQPSDLLMNWKIEPALEPNRFFVRVHCPHGNLEELAATNPFGAPPAAPYIVPTTAANLQRKTGCVCSRFVPPFPAGSGGGDPPAYVTVLPAGYSEATSA